MTVDVPEFSPVYLELRPAEAVRFRRNALPPGDLGFNLCAQFPS